MILKLIMFLVNTVVFIFFFLFVDWRLKKIKDELNSMAKSETLLEEEKKLRKLVVFLFIFFYLIASIYILVYF
jgi:hypothetical protein